MFDFYDDYGDKYPNLIIELIDFFDISNAHHSNGTCYFRKVIEFCNTETPPYQPVIIDRICKRLCELNLMSCKDNADGMGINNTYVTILHDKHIFNTNKVIWKDIYNSYVYGFPYLYKVFKDSVLPLVGELDNGFGVATGFEFMNGIVTAKHCIEDVKSLSIKGYKADDLVDCDIIISDNPNLDIVFIQTNRSCRYPLTIDEGKIMDDVLVMGYPKIPTFTDFCTAELAKISSKASARITPTTGTIAAYGTQYTARIEAMLITAKIRGGNSGGPIINQYGKLVGITCQLPDYRNSCGEYDDLGYGIAVPSSYLNELIVNKPKIINKSKDFFRDWTE